MVTKFLNHKTWLLELFNFVFQIDCQFYTSELISLLLETETDGEDHQQMIQVGQRQIYKKNIAKKMFLPKASSF